MTLTRPYRALALPALALLVPSLFTGVLAFQWLAVRNEANELRSDKAAALALRGLRQDFADLTAKTAGQLLSRLLREPRALPDGDSAWPSIVTEAFLLDGANRLADAGRAAMTGPAAAAERAAALLESGAQTLSAGRFEETDRAASEVFACCAGARDEFGVSYTIYAAAQRLAVDGRRPDRARLAAIVQQVRAAIDAGHLSRSTDVVSIRLLAERLADAPGASALAPLVDEKVAASARRSSSVRAAEAWLESVDWASATPAAPVVFGKWREGSAGTLAAAWRSSPEQAVVLVIDNQALGEWIARQSAVRSSFVFELSAPPNASNAANAVLTAPLFAEAPAVTVAVRRGGNDPATDRRRDRLFLMAAMTALALTLVAGYFAARDVVRELRMASVRSTFLAGVTHEIKTPLTSIRLLAETLQQRRVSPGDAHELLGTIVNETEHLSGLVDNVLGTSRIESGTRTYHRKLVSVPDVVRATHRRFEYTLSKEGFRMVESIPEAPVWVRADPDALAQAVLNLLGNATKYSEDSREIRLTVATTGDCALISVADDGVGIPAAEQSRVFDSFYRARATSTQTTGTGLGLALVKHFAEAHGGRVVLTSEPGRGSVFTILLPLAQAPEPESAAHG